MRTFDQRTIDHAATLGIAADELPIICNGCSGALDDVMRWVNKYIRRVGDRPTAFSWACDIHDIDYKWGGSAKDRARADKRLRRNIAENLRERGRPWWVRLHVPWCVWAGVRIGGRKYWAA